MRYTVSQSSPTQALVNLWGRKAVRPGVRCVLEQRAADLISHPEKLPILDLRQW